MFSFGEHRKPPCAGIRTIDMATTAGTLATTDKETISYVHYKDHHNRVVVIAPGFYDSKDSELFQKPACL